MSKACFRVNYYKGGQPVTTYVVAESDNEATAFLGVQDGSASATRVASPVEVAGVDPTHAAIPPLPVTTAPFDSPRAVSRSDFEALQHQVSDIQAQLAGQGKPVSPVNQP